MRQVKLAALPSAAAPWRAAITTDHLLIFSIDGLRYGLHLDNVRQVLPAAAVTPLPQAPDVVLGVLDLHGEVIPVINLRKRFRLPETGIRSEDHYVVARTARRTLALVVDRAEGILESADRVTIAPDDIVAGTGFLKGVTRTADGLVLIHDLEALLFPAEEQLLARALEQAP